MFDANLRFLPLGTEFFAEVYYCEGSVLDKKLGLKQNDVIRCKIIDECDDHPNVEITHKGKTITVGYHEDFYEKLVVYAGKLDGTDFIKDSTRNKALGILGGTWGG